MQQISKFELTIDFEKKVKNLHFGQNGEIKKRLKDQFSPFWVITTLLELIFAGINFRE